MKITSLMKRLQAKLSSEAASSGVSNQTHQHTATERARREMPLTGYKDNLIATRYVDNLSNDDLARLNKLLDWNCFTADGAGRRFGNAAWEGKRCEPQLIPDKRILLMNERFDLSDKHALEVGCFEGIHTIGLAKFARRVTAIDARIENVVKTIVRCALFGQHPTVFQCDIEGESVNTDLLSADVMYHVGVLYHLKDPVSHLLNIGKYIRDGVMLDTHFALADGACEAYEVDGRSYQYKRYSEFGHADPFSGVYDHSKWLLLDDIIGALKASGFAKVDVLEIRHERNGERALLMAHRL